MGIEAESSLGARGATRNGEDEAWIASPQTHLLVFAQLEHLVDRPAVLHLTLGEEVVDLFDIDLDKGAASTHDEASNRSELHERRPPITNHYWNIRERRFHQSERHERSGGHGAYSSTAYECRASHRMRS